MSGKWRVFPFTALVGQEKIKRALLANAVLPSIGGVLLRGEKGTAKSTAVRGLVSLLPQSQAVAGCPWHCDPLAPEEWLCPSCAGKKRKGALPSVAFAPQLADVPLSASEDRVAGSLDMEAAFREGVRALQPGLLAAAHRGILYIDEVNLLPDHVADIILEACSEGVNRIRREGISAEHPSRFVLVGTMNPEEGELRPQLLDRFGLAVSVSAPGDVGERLEVLRLRERFDADPQGFLLQYAEREAALAVRIREAQRLVAQVRIPRLLLKRMAELAAETHCAGHRGELALERTARAFAALAGRLDVREEDVLEAAEQRSYAIRQGRAARGLTPISAVLLDVYDRPYELAASDAAVPGLSSGLGDLDLAISGLNKSDLILLAARPGMGKTSFALNVALNVAKAVHKTVAVFSLEMSREQLATRLLASEALVENNRLKTGALRETDWEKIAGAATILNKVDIRIDDNPMLSVADMNAKCRRLDDLGLVVIDYLQLMTSAGGKGYAGENRQQVVSDISRMLKIMAKELNVPVICLSQLSRASEKRDDKRPMLSDLRESGAIEHDADFVLFLYRDDYYNEDSEKHNIAECIVAKNRHGETGKVELRWMPEYTQFSTLDTRYDED